MPQQLQRENEPFSLWERMGEGARAQLKRAPLFLGRSIGPFAPQNKIHPFPDANAEDFFCGLF
jgi:hypothetical protein